MAEDQTPSQLPPPPAQPPVMPPPTVPPNPESQARTWNMLCHLSALSACLGVPFGNVLGPLIVWQIKKNEIPSVDVHGKAALNFQITFTLASLAAGTITFLLVLMCIGWLLLPLLIGLISIMSIGWLVFTIIASIKASNGETYQYPWSLTLIK